MDQSLDDLITSEKKENRREPRRRGRGKREDRSERSHPYKVIIFQIFNF